MQNMGTEGAMEWVLGHMEDADFNEPLPDPSAAAQPSTAPAAEAAADPESVMMLVSMGFTDVQAAAALKVSTKATLSLALSHSPPLPLHTLQAPGLVSLEILPLLIHCYRFTGRHSVVCYG